jgi:prepilin-type N-terminal cleavage/methylation domain-containing protein
VISPPNSHRITYGKVGFSLIEMVAVIAILVILMTAGVSLLSGTGAQSRRAGTDLLTGLVEQARTRAITSRSHIVLAIAEPGDLVNGDERCRIGMFRVDEWPTGATPVTSLNGVLLNRWQTLDTGIALVGGQIDGVENPLDSPQITLAYGAGKSVKVHAIAFSPRGGLHHPTGSTPVVMRLAEGNYRGGVATPYLRGAAKTIAESRLKIGRVTARPYRIDG